MKPIYNKTAIENMVELIKDSHPELEMTPSQIVLTPPVFDVNTSKTKVNLSGAPKSGFVGSKALLYKRLKLSTYLNAGQFLVVGASTSNDNLLDIVASKLGLVKSELTMDLTIRPNLTTNKIVLATLSVRAGLIYDKAESYTIYLSSVDRDELSSVTVIIPDNSISKGGDTITIVTSDGKEVIFTKDDEGIWNSNDGDFILTTNGDRVTIVGTDDFTIISGTSDLADRVPGSIAPIPSIISGERTTTMGCSRGINPDGNIRATITSL